MMTSHQKLAILGGPPIRKLGWPKWPAAPEGTVEVLAKVLASRRWTVSSQFTGEASFESIFAREFAAFNEVSFCVPCCSGTAALTIALEALGIGYGDEVLVPGLTWVACATAVLRVGACPVLIDIDPTNLCMSADDAKRSLTYRTKAIVLVHSYCSVADLNSFLAFARENHLYLIEDCSQAHGSLYFGSRVGSFGHVSVFSMQQSKVLTSGEGGAALTNSSRIFHRLDQLRADGRETLPAPRKGQFQLSPRGTVQGHNYCLSEFHAAVLLGQLGSLTEQNEVRAINAEYLNELLQKLGFLELIYRPTVEVQPTIYRYCFRLRREDFAGIGIQLLAEALAAELAISVETLHPPLNRNILYCPSLSRRLPPEVYEYCDPARFPLPKATEAWKSCLGIPHQAMLGSSRDMHDITAALEKLQAGAESLNVMLRDSPASSLNHQQGCE